MGRGVGDRGYWYAGLLGAVQDYWALGCSTKPAWGRDCWATRDKSYGLLVRWECRAAGLVAAGLVAVSTAAELVAAMTGAGGYCYKSV